MHPFQIGLVQITAPLHNIYGSGSMKDRLVRIIASVLERAAHPWRTAGTQAAPREL